MKSNKKKLKKNKCLSDAQENKNVRLMEVTKTNQDLRMDGIQ